MWRHIASNALTFFIVALFLIGGLIAWGSKQYSAEGPLQQAICLRVESGETMRGVRDDLVKQGAVSSGIIFGIGADYSDKSRQLKAGSFLVPEKTSMAQIVEIITRGGASTCGTEVVYRVGVTRNTVVVRELDPVTQRYVEKVSFQPGADADPPEYTQVAGQSDTRFSILAAEGTTSWQIVTALNDNPLLGEDLATIPDEGTLAPDSYSFKPGDSVASIVERMATAQSAILAEAWSQRADGLPYKTPEEALIMASIVEKETGVPDERSKVASVFVNRLKQGIKLQTDPAVIYGITKGEGVLGRGLRQSELRARTPYNTYVIDALPPTPICNPGRASIEAALNPAQTDYIFFVADGTGGHAFSDNLAEHNRNVARWREIEAEQAAAAAAAAAGSGESGASDNSSGN